MEQHYTLTERMELRHIQKNNPRGAVIDRALEILKARQPKFDASRVEAIARRAIQLVDRLGLDTSRPVRALVALGWCVYVAPELENSACILRSSTPYEHRSACVRDERDVSQLRWCLVSALLESALRGTPIDEEGHAAIFERIHSALYAGVVA